MKVSLRDLPALTLSLAVSGVAMGGSVFAGPGHVTVAKQSTGAGVASGYLGAIYNGNGLIEFIGCQKNSLDAVFCHAKTEVGVIASCSITSNYLAQSVAALSPDARLTFRWDATGRCTSITVVHSSEYQDKQD